MTQTLPGVRPPQPPAGQLRGPVLTMDEWIAAEKARRLNEAIQHELDINGGPGPDNRMETLRALIYPPPTGRTFSGHR